MRVESLSIIRAYKLGSSINSTIVMRSKIINNWITYFWS